MSNSYCNVWAVKVRTNCVPVKAGDMIVVTTKAGKEKTEDVRAVVMTGQDQIGAYTLCIVGSSLRGIS